MTLNLLLVEDTQSDVFFMKRAMKVVGVTHPLHVVEDGQQALDYLQGAGPFADRGQFPLPCLILLDLKLPQVPGLEVLEWIRARPGLETIPVVVFTSSSLDDDIDRAYRLGANSYLVKPMSLDALVEVVKGINDYWLKLNRLPPQFFDFSIQASREIGNE